MGIIGLKEDRRYRAYLVWATRTEFIEVKSSPEVSEDNIRIETTDFIKRFLLPDYMGNKVDLLI